MDFETLKELVEEQTSCTIFRWGRGLAIASWNKGHSNWNVSDMMGGYGYGRTPEAAAGECGRVRVQSLKQIAEELNINLDGYDE